MTDDRTLRIVVLPDAPSTGPMLELLRALVAQSVIDPPLLLVDEAADARRLGATEDDDEIAPLRKRIEEAACQRFLLINLLTADSVGAGSASPAEAAGDADLSDVGAETQPESPELRTAFEVDLFIRNALAAKSGRDGEQANQYLDVINLAVPAAQTESLPAVLHSRGPAVSANAGGWWNVVVAPEVQETSLQATVPVTADETYVAHAVAALISVAGCWAGASWETDLPPYDPDAWTVLRSRSRSLVAPELPIRVLGRVGQTASRIPIHDRIEFQIAPEPEHAIKLASQQLIKRHNLDRAAFADVSYRPPQQKVGLREFFRILWAWLTGSLPTMVGGMIQDRVRDIKNQADAAINRGLGIGPDSDIRVQVFGEDEAEVEAVPEEDYTKERYWGFLRPEPAIWSDLRSVSFGLLDGDEVPDPSLQRLLGVGDQRFVLGDRTWISPPPETPIWEPPKAVTEFGLGPPATRRVVDVEWADAWEDAFDQVLDPEEDREAAGDTDDPIAAARKMFRAARGRAKGSLLWGLAEHLGEQRKQILAHLDDLRAQLEDAKEISEDDIEAEGKRTKRKAWVRLLLSALLIVALGVAAGFGIAASALSGTLLVVVIAVTAVVLLYGLVRSLWRCVYSWFLADHKMLWLRKGRVQVLEGAIDFDEIQLRRFVYLCFAQQEWADVIATICFHPFRRPQAQRHNRIREPDLGLPSSHQIVEGHTAAPRLDGVVAAVAATLIRPGWLGVTFESARQYAVEEHKLRTRGGAFEPDLDPAVSAEVIGARRALRDAILTGRARHRRELEVLSAIHSSIRSGTGYLTEATEADREVVDRLFTPLLSGQAPSVFLDESFLGEPSNFNRVFTPFDHVPERRASERSGEVVLPALPSTEAMIEGATVSFPPVVVTSWSIETAERVPVGGLPVFTEAPVPAVIDLSVASTRWLCPPDRDAGETVIIDPAEHSNWRLDGVELPLVGDLIRQDPDARRPPGRGPYRFVMEEDGEPLSHPLGAPILYAVRRDCAAPGAIEMVTRALQCIADLTGYEFRFDGTFGGVPRQTVERVEIGWAFNDEFREWELRHEPDRAGEAIGWGGSCSRLLTGATTTRVLSGGIVLLNADMKADLGFVNGFSHGSVLLHELGHVMNLHHVADQREIMCPGVPAVRTPLDFGPGDGCGLRELSSLARRL